MRRLSRPLAGLVVSLALTACETTGPSVGGPNPTPDAGKRRFRFEYEATIGGFPRGAEKARIWVPLPSSDETQTISDLSITAPSDVRRTTESQYGNRLAYLELEAPLPESVTVLVTCDVERSEVSERSSPPGSATRERLLQGDRMATIDARIRERATVAVAGADETLAKARGIYDKVLLDVDYDKSGQGWGRGDLAYVCDVGKGNCSDFHTYFIGMARAQAIPAVFEIGFPLPPAATEGEIGGYHCWAWYEDSPGRWRPVDASEADKHPEKTEYFFGTIDADRIAFTAGRDLVLEPPQDGEPVNFLIYPYVEVDGDPAVASVGRRFAFRNLD